MDFFLQSTVMSNINKKWFFTLCFTTVILASQKADHHLWSGMILFCEMIAKVSGKFSTASQQPAKCARHITFQCKDTIAQRALGVIPWKGTPFRGANGKRSLWDTIWEEAAPGSLLLPNATSCYLVVGCVWLSHESSDSQLATWSQCQLDGWPRRNTAEHATVRSQPLKGKASHPLHLCSRVDATFTGFPVVAIAFSLLSRMRKLGLWSSKKLKIEALFTVFLDFAVCL